MSDYPELHTITVEADDLQSHADALCRIHDGELFAVFVRGVVDPELLGRLWQRLEQDADDLPRGSLPPAYGLTSRGMCLDMARGCMDDYYAAARGFDAGVPALVDFDFGARVQAILSGLSGGRPVERMVSADGQPYMAVTFRRIRPGGLLPAHWENEHTRFSSYEHLNTCFDGNMISVLMPMASPEAGGQVVAHPFPWKDQPDDRPTEAELAAAPVTELWPEPGGMVIFDAGRWYHEVLPVQGSRPRWTVGAFTGFSRDGDRLYFWS